MVKGKRWSQLMMAKLHLRTDPLTLFMLLLAAYGVGMTLRGLQRHKASVEATVVAAAVAAAVGGMEQGEGGMKTISRKRRSPSRDNLWWLEGAADLLGRLAVPETRCRKMMARQGENCGSPGVLGCLDRDVAPHVNSCYVYTVADHQGQQPPLPSDLFFGCKQISLDIGRDSPPGLIREAGESDGKDDKATRFLQVQGSALQWSVLPRLVSSGLLRGMKQLLIEVHVAMGDGIETEAGDSGGQAAPALRDHWRALETLSSLGFRRAHFIPNPSSSVFHPVPPVDKNLKNLSISDPSLDASYYIQPDVYRTPLASNLGPSTVDGATLRAPDFPHEPDSEERETSDMMADEHLICGVVLYLYRPDVPLPVPPAPYQDKKWRNNYDPYVSTEATLLHYNASVMPEPSITNLHDELLLV